jgi:diguanylate cyclase (GGDEF)-like protein
MNVDAKLVFVLSLSVAAQVGAAVFAWRGMGNSGRFRFAWLCICIALLLMVEQRFLPLLRVLEGVSADRLDAAFGLAISLLMLLGVWGLRRLFVTMRRHEETLSNLARTDALTGVPNRREIMARLQAELERSDRSLRPVSLLMLDLDHFKAVNDRHGHATGDRVLQATAEAGLSVLRRIDSMGRIGGEEFLVVLPGANAEDARVAAERLRLAVAAASIPVADRTIGVTTSIGTATHLPGAMQITAERLVEAADAALYRAKEAGRNCVVMAA